MLWLSRQPYICSDKRRVLSRQTRDCRHKTFVATEMILVAGPANDTCVPVCVWWVERREAVWA